MHDFFQCWWVEPEKAGFKLHQARASWAVHAAGHDEWNAFDAAFGGLVPLFQVSRFTENWLQMGSCSGCSLQPLPMATWVR